MGYVDQGYEAVSPDTTFDVLIPLAMGSDYPIPVTDGDNKLVGEIHRSALAEALAETSTADQDFEANVAANAALAAESEAESQIEGGLTEVERRDRRKDWRLLWLK